MMKNWFAILGCIFIFGVFATEAQAQANPLVFKNANIVNGVDKEISVGQTLVVRNGVIDKILSPDAPLPEDSEIFDVENGYLLPGLIDAHAHVSSLENAERALQYGTTTIRSASVGSYADVAMQKLVQTGEFAGPEIIPAGVFVQPDLGEDVLGDPELAGFYNRKVESEEDLRKLVQINIDNGVQFIKTRSAERAGSPETDPRKQVYTEEQISFIVDEASQSDIPVMAHAHGSVDAAVNAGVRSIEHGTYASREDLELMRKKDTYLVPTYSTVEDLTLPGGDYDHPVTNIRGQHMLPKMEETVQTAIEIGVKLVASTDSGYGPESFNRVPTEVINFVTLGMDPFEAIQSATLTAAELLQIEDRTGTIEEGKEADLIVVYDNPLEDIRALQDVVMVVSNGEVTLNRLPFEIEE